MLQFNAAFPAEVFPTKGTRRDASKTGASKIVNILLALQTSRENHNFPPRPSFQPEPSNLRKLVQSIHVCLLGLQLSYAGSVTYERLPASPGASS